jgi:site-specific recombinase XerD
MDNLEAVQRFEAYLRRRYPNRRTPVDYVSDIRQFQQACAKSWDSVTVPDIDQFVDHMHQRALKPATITRRVMAVKVYFDFLANDTENFNHPNPVHLKRHAAKLGQHLPHDLSDAEVMRLWNSLASPRDRALVALLWHAGLRVAEVVGLTLEDVMPIAPREADSRLPARVRVLGKGQKERSVYLNQETYTVLQAWLTVRPTMASRIIFLNERGQPLRANGVEWLLKRYGEQIGVHLTPHRLRHTFARQLIEAQMPIESLASLMGHAQISTTQIYLAGADPAVRQTFEQAMQRLENTTRHATTTETPRRVAAALGTTVAQSPKPAEPRYPAVPDGAGWATDLPEAIRAACLAQIQRLVPHWRVSQRPRNVRALLWAFEGCFRFVLTRHALNGVGELTPEDLRAYIDLLQQRGLKASSLRSRLHPILALLRVLSEQGEPIAPGLLRIERPPLSDVLPRALNESEAQRVETCARQWLLRDSTDAARDVACYFLLAHTGMRSCELLDLRQADVDLASRRVRIRHGKQERERIVYLTATAATAVRRYLERCPHPGHSLLLVTEQGAPLPSVWLRKRMEKLGHAAGVARVTPHRLRHTFATRLINEGVPITTLQKLLGHRFLSTTQIYARVHDVTVERDYRRAMERLEQTHGIPVPRDWFQRTASSADARISTAPTMVVS